MPRPTSESAIKTQLSGKLSKRDKGIFALRKKLIKAGIEVEFPFSGIVGEWKGIPVTFASTAERSFYDVELAFFYAIRTNPVHVVHNKYGKRLGYIGESASMEIAYAILRNKPIVFLYKPRCSKNVPSSVKKLIKSNISRFFIKRIDLLSGKNLVAYVASAIRSFGDRYDPCEVETEIGVMEAIADLFNSYKTK